MMNKRQYYEKKNRNYLRSLSSFLHHRYTLKKEPGSSYILYLKGGACQYDIPKKKNYR